MALDERPGAGSKAYGITAQNGSDSLDSGQFRDGPSSANRPLLATTAVGSQRFSHHATGRGRQGLSVTGRPAVGAGPAPTVGGWHHHGSETGPVPPEVPGRPTADGRSSMAECRGSPGRDG